MKFLVDFVNHFLKPGGEITFLHIIASDLFPFRQPNGAGP